MSLISCAAFSQDMPIDNNWETIYTGQGLIVSFKKAQCQIPSEGIDMEEVYLKFSNIGNKTIQVDWQYDVTYGNQCFNCEGGMEEMSQTLQLDPNQSISGVCGDKDVNRLRLFSKFLNMENPSVLENFNVKGIEVRELKK